MVTRTPKYNPRRVSQYVPAMQYAAAVVHAAPFEVDIGPVAVADTDNILDAQSIATAGSTTTFLQDNTDPIQTALIDKYPYGPGFGRCLQVVASGAATSSVTVTGRDYLGQPMKETFTLNGTNAVVGVKAFKWIDKVEWSGTAATTIDLGTTDKLGLPYRARSILAEYSNGVLASAGTFVTPSLVDPQTATTTDPRGTYDPNTTLDGSKVIKLIAMLNGELNSSGNGGLHGLAHYYA